MAQYKQIDCFNVNKKFWKVLGIWPGDNPSPYYKYYSTIFVFVVLVFYNILFTINFFFMEMNLDKIVEALIFYFTELAIVVKAFTFLILKKDIVDIFDILESDMFQGDNEKSFKIIHAAKKFNLKYWKIVAVVSVTSNLTHILPPLLKNLLFSTKLELVVSSYEFIPQTIREAFIYPIYLYQCCGMHFHVHYNVNIDTFCLALMILAIAQLDILDDRLRNITEDVEFFDGNKTERRPPTENEVIEKLNKCIIHYGELSKFCSKLQNVMSGLIFAQFSVSSCIICICLFKFTLPAPFQYYIFLATYTCVMVLQILLPCWFGTRLNDKSFNLSSAIYHCGWTTQNRRFKSSMRLLVERTQRPLGITGGKMFPLSLATFTSIMNSAYSFFTLLRHMQGRENI